MKNKAWIVLLLFAIVHNGNAQIGPKINYEYKICDKGDVPYGDHCKFKFPIQNTGDAPLIIAAVRSSCGCLVPEWPRKPIEPGQWDTIYGIYDTRRLGPINKSLTVECNDTSQPIAVLRIKGAVFQEIVSELAFYINDELLTLDKRNNAGFNKSEQESASFRVVNTTENTQTFNIRLHRINSHYEEPGETSKTLKPKEEYELNLVRRKNANGDYERLSIYVTLEGKKYNRTVVIDENY